MTRKTVQTFQRILNNQEGGLRAVFLITVTPALTLLFKLEQTFFDSLTSTSMKHTINENTE